MNENSFPCELTRVVVALVVAFAFAFTPAPAADDTWSGTISITKSAESTTVSPPTPLLRRHFTRFCAMRSQLSWAAAPHPAAYLTA